MEQIVVTTADGEEQKDCKPNYEFRTTAQQGAFGASICYYIMSICFFAFGIMTMGGKNNSPPAPPQTLGLQRG